MTTMVSDVRKMKVVREILDINDEGILIGTIEYIRRAKTPIHPSAPPEGFMTGDEFESRVKDELKQLYIEGSKNDVSAAMNPIFTKNSKPPL